MGIKLSPAIEKRLHGAIQRFAAEEYCDNAGELGQGLRERDPAQAGP